MRFRLTEELAGGAKRRLIDPAALDAARVLKERERDSERRRQGGPGLSWGEKAVLLRCWGNTCALCGGFLALREMTVDHLTPLARKGTGRLANVAPAHPSCNQRKNCRTAAEYGVPGAEKRARGIASRVAAAVAGDIEAWAWFRSVSSGIDLGARNIFWSGGAEAPRRSDDD